MMDLKPLDIKPTGHSHVSYINENSLVSNTFKHHFYFNFQDFIIPKKGFIMNNKQKLNKNCSCKMIKWTKGCIKELGKLSKEGLSDSLIAEDLVKKFNVRFTAMSVKRKRHRLNLLKKEKSVINDSTFYIKISKREKGLGFNPAYVPLEIIKAHNLKDGDMVIFRKNDEFFFSKVAKIIRNDRPNNYYNFYVPYKLVGSTKFNAEIIKYIGKLDNFKKNGTPISKNNIDVLSLLENKINGKIQVCLHPFSKDKVLIGNGRASVPIQIAKKIELSEELLQCLGFFQGEGTKGHYRRIEITNTDSSLLNLFIKIIRNTFNIENIQWKARVGYTKQNKDAKLEENLIKYWSKEINIPIDNFVKSYWFQGNPNALKGGVQLYLPNSSLREVWFNLLRLSYNLIEREEKYAQWFLQGVLAADGCPIISKNYLHCIQIRIENKEEGELYVKALNKIGINANLNIERREIRIYRDENVIKAMEYDLFGLHKERKEKFLKYLYTRKRIKHLVGGRPM